MTAATASKAMLIVSNDKPNKSIIFVINVCLRITFFDYNTAFYTIQYDLHKKYVLFCLFAHHVCLLCVIFAIFYPIHLPICKNNKTRRYAILFMQNCKILHKFLNHSFATFLLFLGIVLYLFCDIIKQ